MIQPALFKTDESAEVYTAERCYILEIANSPDDPDVSIARARVVPGETTCWHSLRDVAERYLIISGQGLVELGDLSRYSVKTGDIINIPAGMPQRITNTGSSDLLFYAICSPRFTADCYVALE